MREIKFRALLDRTKYDSSYKHWFYSDEMGLGEFFLMVAKNNLEPDEYTGLKDKNGKEAYHKDIIKDFALGELWLVEWSDEYACFELQRITENTIKVDGILETISACRIVDFGEVIGNIYENPELLK